MRATTSPARQIDALRERIRRHDVQYYEHDRPTISDAAYDALVARLRRLERAHPELVTPDSPTQRVPGRSAAPFASRRHAAPMLSLDATRDATSIRAFVTRVLRQGDGVTGAPSGRALLLEPKLDGLSVELVYRNGVLSAAATRGDGRVGEDVTANARTIATIPTRLAGGRVRLPPMVAIRGEVMMNRSAFARMNRALVTRGEEPFANSRNAAAGALRQLDSTITARRPLRFVAYEILALDGMQLTTDDEALASFRRWGFAIPAFIARASSADDIARYHRRLATRRERIDYEIDGIVVKVNALRLRERLGATGHHPRWAMAWKFEPRAETTIVDDIVFQVGRTGALTPVALLRPVDVGGVTVSRATLHNLTELTRRDIAVGDTVRVHRAGDVIPEIVERRKGRRRRKARVPRQCPACRTRLVRDGPILRCPNRWACQAQLVAALCHLARDEAFSIAGLGTEVAQRLVEARLVRRLPDLFTLTAEDFAQLPGFAARSANKLTQEVRRARRVPLAQFLVGLGLPGVGRASARALATTFWTLDGVRRASEGQLDDVRDIGMVEARAIHSALRDRRTRALIDGFLRAGVDVRPAQAAPTSSAGALAGRRIAFTGTLPTLSRDEAARLAESRGANVTDSVSKSLDILVVGREPGTKAGRARRLGVRTIDERAFLQLAVRAKA